MISKSALCLAVVLAVNCGPVLAWGEKGHQIVGQIAELRCKPKTLEAVRRFLHDPKNTSKVERGKDFPGTLMEASTWPDELRGLGMEGDESSFEFLKLYPDPRGWHFINLPLGTKSADQFKDFRSPMCRTSSRKSSSARGCL